jgi:hypothetical protein
MYTACGWLRVQRIRRRGIEPADPAGISTLESLMWRLQISRPVRLYVSAIAQVPTVIGWVRPYILLPISAITGLGEAQAQLQAVLAHELAHIRRYDYLINLEGIFDSMNSFRAAALARAISESRLHPSDRPGAKHVPNSNGVQFQSAASFVDGQSGAIRPVEASVFAWLRICPEAR